MYQWIKMCGYERYLLKKCVVITMATESSIHLNCQSDV